MRVPAHRIHHKITVYTDLFEVDAGHTTAIRDQSCGLCGANVESRFAFDGTPQSRIEHWTSTQDHEQVLVAGLAFGPVREEVRLIELADAQPNQIGVHVWESVSQDPPTETEEVVWLTELRHRYAIASEDDADVLALADDVIPVPDVPEYLQPIVVAIPLQLLAYEIALLCGCDVDKPRNLAKSVTVE